MRGQYLYGREKSLIDGIRGVSMWVSGEKEFCMPERGIRTFVWRCRG